MTKPKLKILKDGEFNDYRDNLKEDQFCELDSLSREEMEYRALEHLCVMKTAWCLTAHKGLRATRPVEPFLSFLIDHEFIEKRKPHKLTASGWDACRDFEARGV
jgi:hypothetical protein